MNSISDYEGQVLEITQPKLLKEIYELKYGEEVLGSMTFPRIFSSNAEVRILNNEWELKKESIWKGIIGVYKKGTELSYVKYIPQSMKKAEIKFYRGDYLDVRQYFFKSIIEVVNNTGDVIITLRSKSGFKKKYLIEILKKNNVIDDNPWILFLLGYIAIEKEKRMHGAG